MEVVEYLEEVRQRYVDKAFDETLTEEGSVHDLITLEFSDKPLRVHLTSLLEKLASSDFEVSQEPWVHERTEYYGYDPRPWITPDIIPYGVLGVWIRASSKTGSFDSQLRLTGHEREPTDVRLPLGLTLKVPVPVSFETIGELSVSFDPSGRELQSYLIILEGILHFGISSSLLVSKQT